MKNDKRVQESKKQRENFRLFYSDQQKIGSHFVEKLKINSTKGKIIWGFGILNVILLFVLFHSLKQCNQIRQDLQRVETNDQRVQRLKREYDFKNEQKSEKQLFAYSLFRRPQNQNLLEIEKKRFNSLYEIDEVEEQLPLCVTIVGYNTVQNYRNMLSSVFRQNYTNFHVVHIDDVSPEDAKLKLQKYVNHLSEVHPQKIKMIFNNKKQYALANRDKIIRNHCNPGEIIIDLDSDDALIGKQVFRLVNSFYQKDHDLWLFYMNHIVLHLGENIIPLFSIGGVPDDILQSNTYRTKTMWKSHHLRTYRRELYMKIDRNDFLNPNGEFYIWKADAFILFSLSEMAGKKHQKKIDEPVYFYYQPSLPIKNKKDKRLCYFAFKMQTPYLPLEDLSQEAKKTPNYVLPDWIVIKFAQFQKIYSGDMKINLQNYETALKLKQTSSLQLNEIYQGLPSQESLVNEEQTSQDELSFQDD